MNRVKGIYGPEPMRENEYPISYTVGFDGVTRIDWEMQNYGDHGIGVYHVFKGDDLHATLVLRNLAEVQYFPNTEAADETT